MTTQNQANSFQQYRQYLEQSLGSISLQPPCKPMNPFMRYFFQKGCEQRAKGNKDWKKITKQCSDEWQRLPAAKKSYYQKMFEIRMKQRNQLHQEYLTLTKRKKPVNAYCRFFKKRYALYAKQHPTYNAKDITKLINNDWKNIGQKQKSKLEKQYEDDKILFETKRDDSKRIDQYLQKIKAFQEELQEEKQKIMKKYGISSVLLAKQKMLKQKQIRDKKQLIREKQKEQRKKKLKQQNEKLKKERQQQKLKQKAKLQQEKQKAKKQQVTKKPQAKTQKPAAKTENVKKQVKVAAKKTAPKVQKKLPKASPAKKTKQIKKVAAKKVVKKAAPEVKIQPGKKQTKVTKKPVKSATVAKVASKAKPAKKVGGKRGKK